MAGLEIPEDLDLTNLDEKQKIITLDKLFFKILASDTDLDFEENLGIYLPKLVSKLSTNEELIRKKVMEILVHINKRVKNRPNVQLPIQDFLNQFNNPSNQNQSFVTNFSLMYIKLSFPRLEPKQKSEYIENLLNCLDGKPSAQQDSLLSLVVDGLKHLELNINDSINFTKYGLENNLKIRKYFLDYLFNYLLLPYESPAGKPTTASAQATEATTTTSEIPSCMSEKVHKQFKNDVNLQDIEELEQSKCAILKFLSLNIYKNEDVVFHFIIATSDTRYNVVRVAELHIKRITSVDWNDQSIATRLFSLCLGEKINKKPNQRIDCLNEPANTRIRLKLFPYLLRSRTAANTLPQALQLVFDCLFGTVATNKKIKNYTVQFVHDIAINCDIDKLMKIGAVLVQGLNKLIEECKDDGKLRGLAYVAIGKFARRIPNVISSDIKLVQNFFNALALEELDTKLNIQEALVLMIDAFRNCPIEQKNLVLKMLFQYVENDVPQCRSMAVKYAFEIFENDHLESRFLLILAASDSKEDIRQEALKCLRRTHDHDDVELKIAEFCDLVNFIASKANERIKQNKVITSGIHSIPFDLNSYYEALLLLRMSLSKNANLKAQIIDLRSIDSIKDEAPSLVKYLEKLTNDNIDVLNKYVKLVKDYLVVVGNPLGIYLLLEICATSPFIVTKSLIEDVEWIKTQAFSVKEEIRYYAAELWSIVVLNNIINDKNMNFDCFFANLLNLKKSNLDNVNRTFEQKHGTLLSLGFAIGKFYTFLRDIKSFSLVKKYENQLKSLIESISSYLEDLYMSQAAISSIGEIARNGSLLQTNDSMKKTIEVLQHKLLTQNETNKLKEKVALTLSYICVGRNSEDSDSSDELNHLIMQKLLDSAQIKQIELHMTLGEALVNCAMGNKSPALRNSWTCTEQEWIDKIKETKLQEDKILNNSLNWLLNQLLEKYIDNPNPHLRQAASFWLLTLMKKCSTLVDFIDKNLMAIQDAFILRLGENDEVTQEVASKAIGLIYTLANSEQKKYLVSKLMDTLSGNNSKKSTSSTIKIKDENEEIFKQEQIGKTPDGANITTYKELCSLASDLNQPDLIYRFMNLASHNSMWNTRRGVAFGFQTIANLSTDELQAHLPSLVPRLYRYQFDPNPKIQQSMISIWNSVITQDNKKIIDQYLDIILDDIEKNMLSNLWRIRESCCLALCDLLKGGRNLEPISHKFGAFWSLLFKLIDDIKESVRQSAEIAIKSLNRVTISYSSSITNLSICENTIKSVIPILIQDGFNSKLDTVRDISVKTVLELTKQSISSEFLKPYLLDLIPNLLETLSGYEPPDLNYISLKASNDLQEKLDLARVNASRSTPMFEIINLNLKFIVEPLLSELIPRLVDLVKKGLGVATKAGVCHLISLLIDQSPTLIAPYAGKLMAVFVNALSSEINKTTRKAYSNCLGSIVKTAKESSIENLLNKLKEWYFEKDDNGIKLSAGLTLLSISQNNSEILMKHAKLCVPFIFFAMHQASEKLNDQNEEVKQNDSTAANVWNDVWEEATSGTEYAIKSHLNDILSLIKAGFDHQSWKIRIQAASALSTVFNKLQSKLDPLVINEIFTILNAAVITRIWSGKEKVLLSISSLFSNCKLILKAENEQVLLLIKNVFKEASKQSTNVDPNYKLTSLRCLSDILEYSASNSLDSDFDLYWTTFVEKYFEQDFINLKESEELKQKAESVEDQQKSDEKKEEDRPIEEIKKLKLSETSETIDEAAKELFDNFKFIILATIGKCLPYTAEIQEKYLKNISYLLSSHLDKVTWTNQISIVKSYNQIFEKWAIEVRLDNSEIILTVLNGCAASVTNCIAKTKYSNLKRDGLDLIEKLINILIKESTNNPLWSKLISVQINESQFNKIIQSLQILLEEFSKDSNIDVKEKAKNLLKTLNNKF